MPTDIESYKIKYDGGVGKSPNTYTSYKMKGHELPGPNQRTPATLKAFGTKDSDMPDSVSTTPGKFVGGVGGSPAKGWFKNLREKIKKKISPKTIMDKITGRGDKTAAAEATAGADTSGLEARVAALEETAGEAMEPDMANKPTKTIRATPGGDAGDDTGLGGTANIANPDISMVKPNVGAGFNPLSDIRAKEKIERTGESPSGIPTYEFNYIGENNRYSGVMAQDLLEMNIDAVSIDDDGFYRVNYNNIDVDMRLIN